MPNREAGLRPEGPLKPTEILDHIPHTASKSSLGMFAK